MIHSEIPTTTVIPHDSACERLLLAPLSEAELASLFPLDKAVRETIPYEQQAIFDSAEALCQVFEDNNTSVMGMYAGETSELIGFNTATLLYYEPEVTHYITRPEARGKGFGTLGKLALADFAFERFEVPAVRARTLARNRYSNASLHKTGFLMVGSDAHMVVTDASGQEDLVLHWCLRNPNSFDSQDRSEAFDACQRHLAQRATVDISY